MVETKEKEVVYTTDADAGPSTALVILFSLLIVAVLGFMIYYFSNNDLRTLNSTPNVIERNTNTTTTMPIPVPITAPTNQTPNINITPPASNPAPSPSSSGDPGSGSNSTP